MSTNRIGFKMSLFCFLLLIGCAIGIEKGNAVEPTMDGSTVITFSNPWMKKHVNISLPTGWQTKAKPINIQIEE